ncbi:MAG: glycosyltransferase family 4 protein [Bacteroidota bacterium]
MDYSRYESLNFLIVVNSLNVFGGAERQALILAEYLKQNVSENVSVLAFQDGNVFRPLLAEIGLKIYCFPFKHQVKKVKKLVQYYNLSQLVKGIKPDILIPYVAESNKIVAQIWNHVGAKFAFWNQREEGRKLYGTAHERKLINKLPAIVSNSYEGRDALVRTYGINPERIKVINNGVITVEKLHSTTNWHSAFQLKDDRSLVAMIANITNRKDHKTLLRAWQKVVEAFENKDITPPFLVLAGRKAEAYDSLRLLGFDLRLSNHIGFTGTLSTEKVQDLIYQSAFCVFSSNLEGCPNGVLECMAQGKAVVGTKISGIEQALGRKYETICLSKPNDPNDLANKIKKTIEQPELMAEIGAHNHERIKIDFSVKQMVDQHLSLIDPILS